MWSGSGIHIITSYQFIGFVMDTEIAALEGKLITAWAVKAAWQNTIRLMSLRAIAEQSPRCGGIASGKRALPSQ
jgi:hypothetical protein